MSESYSGLVNHYGLFSQGLRISITFQLMHSCIVHHISCSCGRVYIGEAVR